MYFQRILAKGQFLHCPLFIVVHLLQLLKEYLFGLILISKSELILVLATLFTFLKFVGNLVAFRPHFHVNFTS